MKAPLNKLLRYLNELVQWKTKHQKDTLVENFNGRLILINYDVDQPPISRDLPPWDYFLRDYV